MVERAMEISNKTKRPLRIPLPGGKKLHLGPGRTGQISPKAIDHPALKKLIDDGEVEIVGGGRSQGTGDSGSGASMTPSTGRSSQGGVRHTGDR
jgi:hypothetical protein